MATTKTLTPTNQAITLAAFTEKPDNRTNVTNDDKLADAVNVLNSKTAYNATSISTLANLTTFLNNIPVGKTSFIIASDEAANAVSGLTYITNVTATRISAYFVDLVWGVGDSATGVTRYNSNNNTFSINNISSKIQRITLSVEFTNGSGTIAAESIDGTPFAVYDSSGYMYNISKNSSNWIVTGFYFDSTGKAVFVANGQRSIVISYHKN